MASAIRLITYSGPEEWLRETLSTSLLPEDGTVTFGNKARISAVTIDIPHICSFLVQKLEEDKDG